MARTPLEPNDHRHGTANGYGNLGCRCDRCREAWRIYFCAYAHRRGFWAPMEVYRAEVRDRTVVKHGTETAYVYHRCRCPLCKQASANARYLRRKAVA